MSLPFSEACERNQAPILQRLAPALAQARLVLEIGSGTGQHAVHFAAALPHLAWQPTEQPQALHVLSQRTLAAGLPNLRPPQALDVAQQPWPVAAADALFSANTLHIVSWTLVEQFFRGADLVLPATGASLLVYGPFRYRGAFTTPSNAAFDETLRSRDPASGIRDFEAIDRLAGAAGFTLVDDHAMPANNQLLHWQRSMSSNPRS